MFLHRIRYKGFPLSWPDVRRFEFADLEVYASDEDGELSVSTEADESEEVSDSGSDAADEVDAFFCTLIRAGSAIGCTLFYVTVHCLVSLTVSCSSAWHLYLLHMRCCLRVSKRQAHADKCCHSWRKRNGP